VYDPQTKFFRARLLDGSFREPFDPRAYHIEATEDRNYRDYIEGNAWQWLFAVPHDIYTLVDFFGGPKAFANRLDELISLPPYEGDIMVGDVSGFIGDLAHGNEPCHHYAYLYNYAGQPWKSQELIHRIATEFYKAQPGGYIGNEDAGQMSAWYIFSAMGFYPVNPAGGIYVIGTPLLQEVSLNLENGRTFTMKAHGVSDTNKYIQAVKLNGKVHKNVWITHEDIIGGGRLEFEMGPKPSLWGTHSEKVPLSDGGTKRFTHQKKYGQ
jgi:predicted alpha-1,2-mannosidase